MISLFNLIRDLLLFPVRKLLKRPAKPNIIVIRRFPPRKILRGHQLGLTIGLISVLALIYFNYSTMFSTPLPFTAPLVVFVFVAGTLFSNPFVIIVGMFLLFHLLIFSPSAQLWNALYETSRCYILGYAFGALLATLYNDLVYIQLRLLRRELVKFSFAFDVNKKINIIKSPDEREETALLQVLKPFIYYTQRIKHNEKPEKSVEKVISLITRTYELITENEFLPDLTDLFHHFEEIGISKEISFDQKLTELRNLLLDTNVSNRDENIAYIEKNMEPLVEKYLKLKSRKHYNYRNDKFSKHPYTIAFVANPQVLKYQKSAQNAENYIGDPIIKNIKIFLNSIDNALFSFETNEVIGRPEIWFQIRIIAIFDEKLATESGVDYALVQPFPEQVAFDGVVASNLLFPLDKMWENYQKILRNCDAPHGFTESELEEMIESTDVIFAMSASAHYNRSTALYTDFAQKRKLRKLPKNQFEFHLDPDGTKLNRDEKEILLPTCDEEEDGKIEAEHEEFAQIPGRVALNVMGANLKSYVHEFAHAMSSAVNGAIDDEYFDKKEVLKKKSYKDVIDDIYRPFYINRINRTRNEKIVPVHRIFAEYNGHIYYSDRDHPSAREDWLGYFPDRKNTFTACIMDRNYGAYRYDDLISNFMYDRLMAKINRKHAQPGKARTKKTLNR